MGERLYPPPGPKPAPTSFWAAHTLWSLTDFTNDFHRLYVWEVARAWGESTWIERAAS